MPGGSSSRDFARNRNFGKVRVKLDQLGHERIVAERCDEQLPVIHACQRKICQLERLAVSLEGPAIRKQGIIAARGCFSEPGYIKVAGQADLIAWLRVDRRQQNQHGQNCCDLSRVLKKG
ncbi:hypothetical protein Pden_2186 [Paracoccus denitrificans PD1222]|uniref:Uncharacterized protein n=1 Tax=Paracoccus denitrificans (strain Pd 1222) TaxID=318586 RepID=A1B434_PARDP|nr:hypothetical protein Pden_2186 [Paracoccus denitrificans PD1222]